MVKGNTRQAGSRYAPRPSAAAPVTSPRKHSTGASTASLQYMIITVGICLVLGVQFLMIKNPHLLKDSLQETTLEGFLEASKVSVSLSTPGRVLSSSDIQEYMKSNQIKESGYERIKFYVDRDPQPLRHLQFEDLTIPEQTPQQPMQTAFQEAHVVTRASWFPYGKTCKETCCAQPVAISLDQEERRIVNAVDGQDLADVLLLGHGIPGFQEFAATELTHDIVPCLRPGAVVHADSYETPIRRWFEDYRPNVTVPYVLITSRTDGGCPIKQWNKQLDSDPLLQAWYGINPDYGLGAKHAKFRGMPLGLAGNLYRQQPFLNMLLKARNFTNPFGGDKTRWTNATMWEQAKDTTPILYVQIGLHNAALHRQTPFTMACGGRTMEPLDSISCQHANRSNPVMLRDVYKTAAKYPFGLSPPGNGRDCFRTYELLMHGIIPLVVATPEYDELFRDLPVIQLKGWDYSQQELLKIMRDYVISPAFLENTFEEAWKRLFFSYWRRKVLEDTGRLKEIVRDDNGREYYTAWIYTQHKAPYIPPNLK